MSRRIKIFSTLQGVTDKTVSATTKAELVSVLSREGMITNDMKLIVKETGSSLENDGDILPVGLGRDADGNIADHDFTLFLSPTKTKSGWTK